MKVVTYTTNPRNLGFMLLKASCALNNLRLVALVQDQESFKGFRSKDPALRTYLEELDDEEVILFTDAHDTIMMAGEDEIMEKYARFGKPLVFSAETRSWPDDNMAKLYPKVSDSDHRYLNSGGFVGAVGAIKSMLDEDVGEIPEAFAFSNQYRWALRFLANPELFALDTRCELFYPMFPEPHEDTTISLLDQNQLTDFVIGKRKWFARTFEIRDGRLIHRASGAKPCNAHFNGNGKCMLDPQIMHMILSKIPGSNLYAQVQLEAAAPMAAAAR